MAVVLPLNLSIAVKIYEVKYLKYLYIYVQILDSVL